MNNLLILLQDQAQPQQGGSMLSSLFFILLLIVVFWLFFIRPQSKKAKEEQKFRDSLQKGDKVVTIGGFHGKVVEVKESTVIISLAPNMEVEVEKTALVQNGNRVGQA
jgi:preprotein translocase subunit YajC